MQNNLPSWNITVLNQDSNRKETATSHAVSCDWTQTHRLKCSIITRLLPCVNHTHLFIICLYNMIKLKYRWSVCHLPFNWGSETIFILFILFIEQIYIAATRVLSISTTFAFILELIIKICSDMNDLFRKLIWLYLQDCSIKTYMLSREDTLKIKPTKI